MRTWKVGELAKQTGLTVRTLHHYDEIGLLKPSRRTRSGHRLYGEADVQRLYRILALRRLGFALSEIETVLDADRPICVRRFAVTLRRSSAILPSSGASVSAWSRSSARWSDRSSPRSTSSSTPWRRWP